jgi:hypothetical protein
MTTFSDLKEDGVDLITFNPQVGNIWYVNSSSATKADSAGYGTAPATPFATLDYAIGAATASNGDVIYIAAGHAESKGAGSTFAIDVIGLTIIGLGKGTARPTFTMTATDTIATISAASTWLENILFVAAIDSIVAPLTVSAADVTLKDIEFRDTTDKEFVAGVITTAGAKRLTVDGLFYNGEIATGNACTIGLKLVGVTDAVIKNCRFNGIFSTACIQMVTTACTDIVIKDCFFLNSGTAVTKDIVQTIAASTWKAKDCFDGVAGYKIEGSNAVPLQYVGGKLIASKLSGTITAASQSLWTFMGAIRVYGLYGYVDSVMANTTVNISFAVFGSADTAALPIAAATDFDNHVKDTLWATTGDFSQAVLKTTDVGAIELLQTAVSVPGWLAWSPAATGLIQLVGGHVNAGKLQCYLQWEPASPGAYVLAA